MLDGNDYNSITNLKSRLRETRAELDRLEGKANGDGHEVSALAGAGDAVDRARDELSAFD